MGCPLLCLYVTVHFWFSSNLSHHHQYHHHWIEDITLLNDLWLLGAQWKGDKSARPSFSIAKCCGANWSSLRSTRHTCSIADWYIFLHELYIKWTADMSLICTNQFQLRIYTVHHTPHFLYGSIEWFTLCVYSSIGHALIIVIHNHKVLVDQKTEDVYATITTSILCDSVMIWMLILWSVGLSCFLAYKDMNREQALMIVLDYLYPCRSLDPRLNGTNRQHMTFCMIFCY